MHWGHRQGCSGLARWSAGLGRMNGREDKAGVAKPSRPHRMKLHPEAHNILCSMLHPIPYLTDVPGIMLSAFLGVS